MNDLRHSLNFVKYRSILPVLILGVAVSIHSQTANSSAPAPEGLTVEGAPAISRELAARVSRYTSSRSARFLSWQPVQREMLIATRFGETTQVHRMTRPGGDRTQLTFLPESVLTASYQPTHGRYFVFLKDSAGNENFHLYRQDFLTGSFEQITSAADFDSVDSMAWAQDGSGILYSGVKLKEGETQVCWVNPSEPKSNKCIVKLKGVIWQITDISKDNSQALLYEYIATGKTAVHLLDLRSGDLRRLTPDVSSVFSGAVFRPSEKEVYLSTNWNSEYEYLARFDLASRRLRRHLPESASELESYSVSPDATVVATIYNDNGNSRLTVWDSTTGKELLSPKLPVGVITNLSWLSNTELGFNLETAKFPADVYAYSLKTRRFERWSFSETGGINTTDLREAEVINWPSFDGKVISGVLYRPPPASTTGKLPVLIDVHGGPQMQTRPTFGGRYNYFLKEMGIAVIFPNVRGSSGFGKSFMDADNGINRIGALKDLQALLDWIKTQPELDPDRVAVRGESYGGFLALALGMTVPSRLKGVIATSPIVSVSRYISKSPASLQNYLRAEYGDERDLDQIAFLDKLSPLANEQDWQLPLLLAVGQRDARVPTDAVQLLQANLRKRSVPVAYLRAANEGHVWRNKDNRDYFFYVMVQFLQQVLGEKSKGN